MESIIVLVPRHFGSHIPLGQGVSNSEASLSMESGRQPERLFEKDSKIASGVNVHNYHSWLVKFSIGMRKRVYARSSGFAIIDTFDTISL